MKRAWTKGWIAAAIALAAGDRRCAKAKPPRCTHRDENRGGSGRLCVPKT
jgi:hypothetical protein